MEVLTVKITSLGPMLMHAATTANPLHPGTKAHKMLTSKRKKTDEDQLAIAKSEWLLSLYHDDQLGLFIPGLNLESCVYEAAKLRKLGKTAKRALLVKEDQVKIDYRGPRDPESMYADPAFVDVRAVKVGAAKIMRYRPRLNDWSATFSIVFNPEQIDRSDVVNILNDAGSLVGLGDFRPRFGKFSAAVVE